MCDCKECKCREQFPDEPKFWCEDEMDDFIASNEYRCEGDR